MPVCPERHPGGHCLPDNKGEGPNEDNWGKLKRVLPYITSTIYCPLILCVDSLNVIKWCVDALFNIHPDCKGHMG